MRQLKLSLFCTAALGGLATPAFAQTEGAVQGATAEARSTEAADEGAIDEIIVTAQRRAENVQDVPVAISAFGAEQLARQGVVSIEQIAPRVPSFYFGSFGALRPQLYIRGIGTRSFDPGSESSVGVFVDEVYLGRSSGSFGSLKDIERVEVLRGPQGTLYGRNTIGGAINVITKGPTKELDIQAEAGISNFDGYELFGAIGGPVTSDGSLMARVAAWTTQREGYVTNLGTGTTFQGIDNIGGRLRLAYEPTDALRIDLTAEIVRDGDEGAFGGFNQGTGRSVTGAPPNPRTVFFAPASRIPVVNSDLRRGTFNFDPFLDRDAETFVGRLEYDADFATFTAISSYRTLDVSDGRDLEGSSLDVLDQSSDESSDQFTQELRLTSNSDGMFDWIVGAFYYDDKSERTDSFGIGIDSLVRAAAGTRATDVAASDYKIESYAFFGQATAHFGDRVDLTFGGRYTKDKKRATQGGTTTDAAPIIAVPFSVTNRASYDSFDPRAVLSYKLSDDANIYVSYSTGFKSGGFQYVPFSAAQANVLFEPEDIKTYEIGFKSELLDRTLRLNAAAFRYDYKDLQVSRIIDAGGAPVSLISNAASSRINGFDLEVLARPHENFDVSISYGYLDAKYRDYVFNITQNLDFSGTTLVRAPEHTINVGGEWRIPMGDNRLTLRADYALISDFFHEPGEGDPRFGSGIPLTAEDGYGLLDLRASYELRNWRLTAYVTNVTKEDYRRTVNALGSTIVGFAGTPRIYGLKLAYSY